MPTGFTCCQDLYDQNLVGRGPSTCSVNCRHSLRVLLAFSVSAAESSCSSLLDGGPRSACIGGRLIAFPLDALHSSRRALHLGVLSAEVTDVLSFLTLTDTN